MNKYITSGIACLWAALTVGILPALVVGQTRKAESNSPLTANGDKLLAIYFDILSALKVEIGRHASEGFAESPSRTSG